MESINTLPPQSAKRSPRDPTFRVRLSSFSKEYVDFWKHALVPGERGCRLILDSMQLEKKYPHRPTPVGQAKACPTGINHTRSQKQYNSSILVCAQIFTATRPWRSLPRCAGPLEIGSLPETKKPWAGSRGNQRSQKLPRPQQEQQTGVLFIVTQQAQPAPIMEAMQSQQA